MHGGRRGSNLMTSARKGSKQAARPDEIAIAYGLILAVIWTPRPWQRFLWLVAVAALAAMTCLSITPGWRGEPREWGCAERISFARSGWWARRWPWRPSPLRWQLNRRCSCPSPNEPGIIFIKTYWAYAIWTFVQQFLMQCFFLLRLQRVLPRPRTSAFATAGLFALAHRPIPFLPRSL